MHGWEEDIPFILGHGNKNAPVVTGYAKWSIAERIRDITPLLKEICHKALLGSNTKGEHWHSPGRSKNKLRGFNATFHFCSSFVQSRKKMLLFPSFWAEVAIPCQNFLPQCAVLFPGFVALSAAKLTEMKESANYWNCSTKITFPNPTQTPIEPEFTLNLNSGFHARNGKLILPGDQGGTKHVCKAQNMPNWFHMLRPGPRLGPDSPSQNSPLTGAE